MGIPISFTLFWNPSGLSPGLHLPFSWPCGPGSWSRVRRRSAGFGAIARWSLVPAPRAWFMALWADEPAFPRRRCPWGFMPGLPFSGKRRVLTGLVPGQKSWPLLASIWSDGGGAWASRRLIRII